MEIKERHFPYPIMAEWSDDVQYSATTELQAMADKNNNVYILSYSVILKNASMLQLLYDEKAKLILHLECSNALYRKYFTLTPPAKDSDIVQGEIRLSGDDLCGSTDASLIIVANQAIQNYSPDGIHSDYDGLSCELEKGDLIAALGTHKIPLRQDYDLLKQISTIIVFNRDETRDSGPIKIDFSEDKLVAALPCKLHEKYLALKDNKDCTAILTAMLVMPVLMEGLEFIKGLWVDRGLRNEKWFCLLCKKLDDMQCDMSNSSAVEVAQRILDLPYERASAELKYILGQGI